MAANQTTKFRLTQESLKLAGIFFVTSLIGVIIGKSLDSVFEIQPFGILISLGAMYILSWVVIVKVYKNIINLRSQDYNKDIKNSLESKKNNE